MSLDIWPTKAPEGSSQFRRIRWITYALGAVVVMCTLVLGNFQLRQDYQAIVESEERAASNIVRSMESHLTQVISESRWILEGVSELYVDRLDQNRFDEVFFHGQLGGALERSGILATLFLVDASAFPVAGSSTYPLSEQTRQAVFGPAINVPENELGFQLGPLEQTTIESNEATVGDWYLPLITVARSSSGETAGMMVGVIDPSVFDSFYDTLEVGESGVIQLWSEDGLLIAANDNSPYQTGHRLELVAERMARDFQEFGSGRDGFLQSAIDPMTETLYVGLQSEVLGFRYTAVVNRAASDYLAPLNEGRRRIYVGTLIFVTVLVILMALLLRQLRLTELSQLRTQEAMEEAEDANDARRQFLAQVSHEFRTPLNAIIGFSDMIKESVYGPDIGEKYVESAKHIQMSGNHLLKIVNDIIDITRIDAGEYQIDLEVFSIADCADTAITMLKDTAAQRQVSLKVELGADLPRLNTDKRLATQVLINLLSNAIRFAPEASDVKITARVLDDSRLEVSVTDNGPGLDPGLKDKIGQPFMISGLHVYTKDHGAGLGLSICKKIMDVIGGDLTIQSDIGQGTTASARFPVNTID